MQEYVTSAIILDREIRGESDERVTFFSKHFGKLTARTVSSKKILSKLSPHLEPGNLTTLRLVEKNDLSIVDALKERSFPWRIDTPFQLKKILADNEPDLGLWHLLVSEPSWARVLSLLGWDPRQAQCERCDKEIVSHFSTETQHFFCQRCYELFPKKDTMIQIGDYA